MFYYKYSNYSPEQIINDNYKKIADNLLKISISEEHKEKIKRNIIRWWF